MSLLIIVVQNGCSCGDQRVVDVLDSVSLLRQSFWINSYSSYDSLHVVFIVVVRLVEMILSSVMSCRKVSCDYDHCRYRYRLSSLQLFAVFAIVVIGTLLRWIFLHYVSALAGIAFVHQYRRYDWYYGSFLLVSALPAFYMCHHSYSTCASALCNSCCHITVRVRPAFVALYTDHFIEYFNVVNRLLFAIASRYHSYLTCASALCNSCCHITVRVRPAFVASYILIISSNISMSSIVCYSLSPWLFASHRDAADMHFVLLITFHCCDLNRTWIVPIILRLSYR